MDNSFATGYALGADNSENRNNSGMWGGDGAWLIWLVLIFAIFGWGNGGWGGNRSNGGDGSMNVLPYVMSSGGLGGADTRAAIADGFALNNLQSGINAIQSGLCDSTYALNNAITGGFNAANVAMLQGFNGVQAGQAALGSQLANCCCDIRQQIGEVNYNNATLANATQRQIERGFCDVGYAMATNTTNIIQGQHNDTDRVLAKLDAMETARMQEKIASLQTENQSLKFAASQANQNAYITASQEAQTAELIRRLGRDCPIPAYVVPNPNCCYTYQQPSNACVGCC